MAPVLHGQGYASPGSELWSKVRSPDVATPFSLANQLFARAEQALSRGQRAADLYPEGGRRRIGQQYVLVVYQHLRRSFCFG